MRYYIFVISAVLIFVYITWRVLYNVYNDNKCVEEETLRDISTGKLKKYHRAYADVKRHLLSCKKCQARMYEIQHGKPIEDHLIE